MALLKKYWKIILYAIIGCLFVFLPFYNIIINGTYTPYLKNDPIFQGGIEVVFFAFITLISMRLFEKKAHIVLIFFSCLYLSMAAVIVPVVIVGMYFEMLCYIGSSFNSLKKIEHSKNIALNFVSGISIWGTTSIVASLLNRGTINHLRIVTISLLIVSFVISNKKNYIPLVIRLKNFVAAGNENKYFRYVVVVITFVLLILFAKTNYAIEWDSMHYGLKPELTLIGEESFYNYLGLSCFVHYYPKLWELLFSPLSDLGDYSFLLSVNIFNLLIICYILYEILSIFLSKISVEEKLFVIAIIISIPAVANISVTTKPDILGLLLFLFAFYEIINWMHTKEIRNFTFCMIALLLSTGTKLTYLLWGGILFLFSIGLFLQYSIKNTGILYQLKKLKSIDICLVVTSFVFSLGVHYRTFKLTGYPTYPTGISFYRKLGFSARNHSLLSSIENNANIISDSLKETIFQLINRVYHVLLSPNENYSTLLILWFSNLFVFLIIMCFMYKIYRSAMSDRIDKKLLFFYGTMIGVFSFYMFYITGFIDGNYYVAPIISIIIISYYLIRKYSPIFFEKISRRIFICTLSLFLISQTIITFITSPSWVLGTHAFDIEIVKNNFDTQEKNKEVFLSFGCNEIAKYIDNIPISGKFIASADLGVAAYRFNVPIESYFYIETPKYCNSRIVDYETFKAYLKDTNVSGIVLADSDDGDLKQYTMEYVSEFGISAAVEDENAVLYILND